MTMTENPPEVEEAVEAPAVPERRLVAPPVGLAGWVTTVDHKRIGRLYGAVSLVAIAGALVVGGLLALERIDAGSAQILDLDAVQQMLSLYRYGLVFVGILPLLLGVAIAIVPLQVGAQRIAFPRAAALSFWVWIIGSALMILAYAVNGGPGGGDSEAVDLFLVSLAMVISALLLAASCVVTTALTLRAPGMTLGRAPILAWSAFVTGVMALLSLPVLMADVVLVYVDHHYGRLIFEGNLGIAQYLDWAVSQPQTYLYALIGLGVIGDVVPVMAKVRQPLRFSVLGALAVIAGLSFGGYIQPELLSDVKEQFLYVMTNILVIVPVLAALLLWAFALRKGGKPRLTSPLFFSLGAGLMFLVGAAAGALTPIKNLDLAGTQYELGQFNYVLLAGLLAGAGGLVFWGPKLWGRRLPGRAARALAVLGLLGVILAAFPDLVLGFLEQPLGEVNFDVDQEGLAQVLNGASFVGYVLLLIVVLAFFALAARGFGSSGQAVGADPWDGQTLEWTAGSPPPTDENFPEPVGEVASPEPLLDRKELDRKELDRKEVEG
jgi:heme/copper-type cytochrome/quinol oxidase subunit 1